MSRLAVSRPAVVGMACRYPDAASPRELWENAVAGRRAFRRLPEERMRLADYWDPDPAAPDRFYARQAAVIEGYEFDRVGYKIAGSTYRSTDLTHWLALDMAALALADAGFPMGDGLPRERTGVVVGNTLTGEFTRANVMRLRWPYVRHTVGAALADGGWDAGRVDAFLDDLEARYKSAFPGVDEDTLAGGLSNTIAGRICNYFDLKGGGYTVDGACSSSLLSVATACRALADGDLDVAIAGGVDLSIDPFELVGFAKTGALAKDEMRVYDRGSNGFWPGEGCGMVVLMRAGDAAAAGRRVYAEIAGWGVSSDGHGGITRPEAAGYRLALRRAYERAGFDIGTVPLFEGHGTGTAVGDATELRALSAARAEALAAAPAAPAGTRAGAATISSIKGVIGHTKAAAGVAGLIKAVMAVHEQVLPPAIGCVDPHPILAERPAMLRVLRAAEPWPAGEPLRAGVTSMGFGGINTHIVVENAASPARPGTATAPAALDARTAELASSVQDAELLVIDGAAPERLRDRIARLVEFVPALSYAQLGDLAATLHREAGDLPWRAAVVVSSPEDAERRLRRLLAAIDAGETSLFDAAGRCFLGHARGRGRIGYLFPGQGSGRGQATGGALRRRFAEVAEVYAAYERIAPRPAPGDGARDGVATAVAQPRIAAGSAAALRALSALGIEAEVAVGHSLGEISALHWAGAMDADALVRLAAARGRIMTEHSAAGTMAGIDATPAAVTQLGAGLPIVIAGYNGPNQTVIAGSAEAIEAFGRRADLARVRWTGLRVSHAFHSPLVAPAADAFGRWLDGVDFASIGRRVVSTVTGEALGADTDIAGLLRAQITAPVLFAQAVELAAKDIDLYVEVGPGRVLTGLATGVTEVPAIALDTDDESLRGLLAVVGAAFALGAPVRRERLFAGRLTRPLALGAPLRFFANPCETPARRWRESRPAATAPEPIADEQGVTGAPEASLELLRGLVAERAELPAAMVTDDSRLLDDLHLSSITVGQIVNQVARRLGQPAMRSPTNVATATLRQLADALDTIAATAAEAAGPGAAAGPAGAARAGHAVEVPGAAEWVRAFRVDLDVLPLPAPAPAPAPVPAPGRAATPWRAYAPAGHPLAEPLRVALERADLGPGVLACLPADCAVDDLEPALRAARDAAGDERAGRFVLVQGGGRGAAGLAKTLRQEAPRLSVTIVHLPLGSWPPGSWPLASWPADRVVAAVAAEVAATDRFVEAYYDENGVRRVPTLRPLPARRPGTGTGDRAGRGGPLDATDVVLVTGGAKGITAECGRALAGDAGARLAVIGRSADDRDAELAAALRRLAEGGVTVRYARADLTDPADVRAAVSRLAAELGPITAVLHGAGRNEPMLLTRLDMEEIRRTFAPKVDGLRAVLAAVDPDRLRLLVSFGSILGRTGLPGEAHYAAANEWLAELTAEFAARHPACRAMCLEWSVWSGIGMGERLAVAEGLARDGITPITPDQGVRMLRRLVADAAAPHTVVISGRTGGIDTVRRDAPELPLLRYLEKPLVRYHGVELVTEVELNAGTDPYLADHRLDGNLLFPAVMGMEAMAQVGCGVTGRTEVPVIEDAEFLRPIVVPPDGTTVIRIAATVTDDDTVEVAIRSAETDFAAAHFRARLRYPGAEGSAASAGPTDTKGPRVPEGPPTPVAAGLPPVPLDPAGELYGEVLFQGERFQRLRRYHRLAARQVDVDVAYEPGGEWFARFLPGRLLLGDPGMRDALMHGNQVCVPDATLLPAGIDLVRPAGPIAPDGGPLRCSAVERSQDGDTYVYDIAVRDAAGRPVERWEGLRLRAVRRKDGRGPWAAALLGPYLERTAEALIGAHAAVAVEPAGGGAHGARRRIRTALAVSRVLGRRAGIRYRPDGRPEVDGPWTISAAHGAGVTLAVAARRAGSGTGDGTVACDVEPVTERTGADWTDLLGPHAPLARLVAAETDEGADAAATRVWAAVECLRKAGSSSDAPLTLTSAGRGPWAVLSSGDRHVATLATTLRDGASGGQVVFAVLAAPTEGRSPA
ncbi:MAG TPA: type I polyketide synthase [Streptosporangiaceae bacterium]